MDMIEYNLMSSDARKALANARLSLATLGDAERLAAAYSSCPWLLESSHIEIERGQRYPSLVTALCSQAGADACRKFGSLITPNPDDPEAFETLVEAFVLRDASHMFRQSFPYTAEQMAGTRLANLFQGLDENPHLPSGFGSRVYASLLDPHTPDMLDGIRNPADADWWSKACQMAGQNSRATPKDIPVLHAIQAGETLALLVEALRREPDATPQRAQALGRSFGGAIERLSRDWPTEPKAQEACAVALFKRGGRSWRADLASICCDSGLPTHIGAMEVAISLQGEPFLAALATQAGAGLSRIVETRRLELSIGEGQPGRPLRI